MASKTQFRLAQLTGSLGSSTGQINQATAASSVATIDADDISVVLGHLASSIKRLHGGSDFSNQTAGHFSQNLHITGSVMDFNQATAISTAAGALSIDGAGGINLGTDSDVAFDVNSSTLDVDASGAITIDGTSTFSIDGVGASNVTTKGALTISGSSGLNLKSDGGTLDIETRNSAIDIDAGTTIDIDAASGINIGKAADVAFDVDTAAFDLDASGAVTIDNTSGGISLDSNANSNFTLSDGDLTLEAGGADNKVTIKGDHTGGVAVHIDADENANSILDIDSGKLDIDASGAVTIDGASTMAIVASGTLGINSTGAISFGTHTSGVAIGIGHATSEVTVNDNLTVTGDLTVNGATTTLDTTNLLVEDVVIGMAANAASANQNGGLAIFSGSSDSDLVLGRVANDVWGFGKKATLKGTVTTLADMTLVNARASRYEVDGANDYLDLDDQGDLALVASSAVTLSPGNARIYLEGASYLSGNFLYLDADGDTSIDVNTDDKINFTLAGFSSLYMSASEFDMYISSESGRHLIFTGSGGDNFQHIGFADGFAAGGGMAAIGDSQDGNAVSGVKLAASQAEYTSFASNFSSSTTLVGALNSLASGGTRNKRSNTVTASVNASTFITVASDLSHDNGADSDASDVYLNGQLMLTGSSASNGDYALHGSQENSLKFFFALEIDDVVTVVIP